MSTPVKGQLGLANLGNTCYLNATLQCLRNVADLTVFFHKHSDNWIHDNNAKDAILCNAYKELVRGLWSGMSPAHMKPSGFVHHFRNALRGTAVEHMIAPLPHDSHEALVFLLDQLHEGMKKPLTNITVLAKPEDPAYKALMTWKDQIAPEYSPIVDYFFGLMEVSVSCHGCKNVSCRYEPFNMLKVSFPDNKAATLVECIEHEFQGEALDEYHCDPCAANSKPRGPATIQRRIWRLPRNLIVVLKRFNPNGTKCQANFSTEMVQKFDKWFASASPEGSKSADYTLQSVVDHHGSANGGHYTAQLRSPITAFWTMYDDESVVKIKDGSAPVFGPMSYILFYKKE